MLARGRPRAWLVLVVAIVLAGGALRAAQAAHPQPGLGPEERSYVGAAIRLADHGVYTDIHYPPAAAALFALAYRVGGSEASRSGPPDIPLAYWVQMVLGTALIVAAFALATAIAGPWAGVAAALVTAFYPPFILRTGELLSEPLSALLLVAGAAAVAWAVPRDPPRLWALAIAGACFGGAILARANLLPVPFVVAPVLAVPVLVRHGALRALATAAAATAGALLLVLPWSLYASSRAHHFVPVATGGGSALFIGTFLPADARLGAVKRLLAAEARRHVPPRRMRAKKVLDAVAARYPRMSRDAALALVARHNVAHYVRRQPLEFARLLLAKVPRLWWNYSEGSHRVEATAAVVIHRLLVVLSALALGGGLWRTRHPALVAATAVLATVTAEHVLVQAIPRYAFPLLGLLFSAGAAAAVLLVEDLRARASGPQAVALGRAGPADQIGSPAPRPQRPTGHALATPGRSLSSAARTGALADARISRPPPAVPADAEARPGTVGGRLCARGRATLAIMKVELLYFEGCPSHEAFLPRRRELLARAGAEVALEQRRVESDAAAQRERFLGSPTLRVDGVDVDPGAGDRTDYGLKCRLYPTGEGLRGAPPDEWVLSALRHAGHPEG